MQLSTIGTNFGQHVIVVFL